MKKDLKNLGVRLVGWFAKGMKINNVWVLSICSPIYLAFIWFFLSFRLHAMFTSSAFIWRDMLGVTGRELAATIMCCSLASIFILWPIARILQLSWPEIFDPELDSNDEA